MPFPRGLLADHEELIFDLKPHWVAVVPSVWWTLVALVGLWASYAFMDGTAATIAALVVVVAWVLLAFPPFIRWQFTRFVLTSDRLITRSGFVAKRSKEIPLERINDVSFNQSVFDRMIGAGDLVIESAGERGQEPITNVRHPERVQLMIYEQSEKNQDRMMQPRSTDAPASITDQIEALSRLKDQGVITPAEFEAKKQDLLKRM